MIVPWGKVPQASEPPHFAGHRQARRPFATQSAPLATPRVVLLRLSAQHAHMTSLMLISAIATMLAEPACKSAPGVNATTVLQTAASRTGLQRAGTTVLATVGFDVKSHQFESDRTYAPALTEVAALEHWFDPQTGVERVKQRTTIGGYEYGFEWMGDARGTYLVADTALTPSEETHSGSYETRPLNVWAMLDDWLAATDVRVEGMCDYRDYPRIVLTRRGERGVERLFVDPKSGYPTKLDRLEPHYLWGQLRTEFVYSTWQRVGAAHLPGGAFRLDDGLTTIARTFGRTRLVPRDSAPSLKIPTRAQPMAFALPVFLQPTRPDTIRVSASTFLLRNRGYTEAVTLQRDTVFVFDATQGDERVRQDSMWIATLFPGRHPIAVVVTDLAWPHVAGVRAWVARGATIVSHRAARSFLAEVVNRRWTQSPDLLERRRATARLEFRAVDDSLTLAGGDIALHPIDGAASEVALLGFVRRDRFLWASDFIQNVSAPTQYLDEVAAAVARAHLEPLMVAAEHAPLIAWDRVAPLAAKPFTP
jgi:hypothetical protein